MSPTARNRDQGIDPIITSISNITLMMLNSRAMLRIHRNPWERGLVEGAETYLREAFGWTWRLEPFEPDGLPFFIADNYRLWRADLIGQACVVMAPRPTVDFTAEEMARHVSTVRSRVDTPLVILAFETLTPSRRASLLHRRLAFLVPKAQLFVPEALVDLRERTPRGKPREVERFSPSAQVVVLGDLLEPAGGRMSVTDLAKRYGVAVMSMTRAFDELEAAGVAEAERKGRQRVIQFGKSGRALWEETVGRLQSPVRKVRTVVIPHPDQFAAHIAGESALSRYTDLAAPKVQRLAVAAADWNGLVRDHGLRLTDPGDPAGDEFETWAYDPGALSKDTVVDPLSLHLSLRDHPDERVAAAAEQLLERIPWS